MSRRGPRSYPRSTAPARSVPRGRKAISCRLRLRSRDPEVTCFERSYVLNTPRPANPNSLTCLNTSRPANPYSPQPNPATLSPARRRSPTIPAPSHTPRVTRAWSPAGGGVPRGCDGVQPPSYRRRRSTRNVGELQPPYITVPDGRSPLWVARMAWVGHRQVSSFLITDNSLKLGSAHSSSPRGERGSRAHPSGPWTRSLRS